VIQIAGEYPTEMWAQVALLNLGLVNLEQGLLDEAHRCLQKADNLAEMTRALQSRARIRGRLAQIAWVRGETEEAFDEVERAIGFANQLGTLQEIRYSKAQQARFWLALHQLGLARRWADSCEIDPYLPPEYERKEEYLTYVRLLIQEGKPALALEILQSIQEQAEAAGRYGELVEIMILTALAHKADERIVDALQSLQMALDLGEPAGYFRVFVDEGENLALLLRHAVGRGGHRDYARRILEEIEGSDLQDQYVRSSGPDALSEREVEVLRLVAAGLPNRDIGQRLFISEKTVKTHLSNIISKLETTNRTQAVDQARRLGLI
jgi:LuxR family maltose regulon positive regulatory protein